MILPVYAYGQPVLKKRGEDITKDYPELAQVINNLYETMDHCNGVGIAAPQVGIGIRLFVIDSRRMFEEEEEHLGCRKIFINPEILEESGEVWSYEEGCLSIPGVNGDVNRHEKIKIKYLDENFVEHTEYYDDMNARVIQHEYDHIEGVLFTEKLSPLKKTLIKKKLDKIRTGEISPKYKMKFVGNKK